VYCRLDATAPPEPPVTPQIGSAAQQWPKGYRSSTAEQLAGSGVSLPAAGVGARLWSEPPACHAAIRGGILSAGRCRQESRHGRPEAHSTVAGLAAQVSMKFRGPQALSNRPGGPPY